MPGFEFSLGSVFNRSMGVMSRNVVPFLLLAGVAQIPIFLSTVLSGEVTMTRNPAAMAGVGGGWILYAIINMVTQTMICYAAFQDMSGRPARLGDAFSWALNRFFPLLGLGICMFLTIFVGLLLLVVPGLIWIIMFAVSGTACIVERIGPIASMGRSRFLTKGYRWKLFGIFLLMALAGGTAGGAAAPFGAVLGSTAGALLRLVVQGAVGAFSHVLYAVIYHDLRVVKEGIDTSRIAAVFD